MKKEHTKNKENLKKSNTGYGSLFNNDHVVMLLIEPESLDIIDANNAACKYYGWDSEEIRSKKIFHINTLSFEQIKDELDKAKNEIKNHFFCKHCLANNEIRDVEVYAIPIIIDKKILLCCIVHDITRIKKVEEELLLGEARLKSIIEILQFKHDSIQEFLDFALNEAIKLTDSKIGYIYHYSEKKKQFTLNTWSRSVMIKCEITEAQTVYNLDGTGIWGEAVRQSKTIIVNGFRASNPLKKGYPEGHVELHKFMTIPIFRNNKIVAVVGVANKESNYTENDTLQLTLLMDSVWNIIGQIGSDEALKESEKNYRSLFENDISGVSIHKIILDEDGKPVDYVFLEANEAFEKHTGLKIADIIGKRVTEVIPGIENESFIQTYGKVAITGVPISFEKFSEPLNRYYNINVYWVDNEVFATVFQDITERKNAENVLNKKKEELEKNRERFMLAVNGSQDGIWDWDLHNKKVYFSPKWKDMIGFDDSDFQNTLSNFKETIHPDDRQRVMNHLGKYLKGELSEYHVEFRFRHKNGNYLWILARGAALRDENGFPYRISGSHTDITYIKNVEKEISAERQRLANIIEGTNVGTWEWNVQTGETSFNDRWAQIIGYTLEELTPINIHTWKERVHPDDLEVCEILLRKHFAGELDYYECDARMQHKNGEWIWVHDRGKVIEWDKNGKPLLMYGTHADITERKRAEDKIAEDTIRKRLLVEQSRDGIVVLNLNGKVVEANTKYADMLGYSQDEVLQLHVWDWDNQWTAEEILELLDAADESGITFETHHRRKDGTLFDVEVSSNGAICSDQKLIFCVCRDITERKRAEDALIHAKIDAETANRTKSEFLANMSHELRTPLNSILGFSQMLDDKIPGELNKKQIRYVSNILKSSEHLIELINDILDLSKVEAGKMQLACENFKIADLIGETMISMQPIATNKDIDIRNEIQIENVEMYADRKKIKDILYNLLSNAIKFTPENGKVCIKAICSNDKLHVSVSDSGIGISKVDLLKIFEPFKQVDSFLTRKFTGTGLGLTIVKRYVEMHGGNLHVESEIGNGSTFTFAIPLDLKNGDY